MRRIYLTTIAYQQYLSPKKVNPVNFISSYAKKHPDNLIYFPIVPIISDTMEPGDSAKILAVLPETEVTEQNFQKFQNEIASLQLPKDEKVEIKEIRIPIMQDGSVLNGLLAQLVEQTEDQACYYADITYGTKLYPILFLTALRYAGKICEQTEIGGIYYQEINWLKKGDDNARLYDESAILSLDTVMDQMENVPKKNRMSLIHALLGIKGEKNE